MVRGIEFSKASLIISMTFGLAIILVVGLLSGFLARPSNCINNQSTTVKSTSTSSSSIISTSATTPPIISYSVYLGNIAVLKPISKTIRALTVNDSILLIDKAVYYLKFHL
jgi:hypothetical protein